MALFVVEHAAYGSHGHCLPGGHVGGAAHYLHRSVGSEVYGGDMEMVAVGVRLAGQHLADDHAAQSARHGLYLFNSVTFQS